MGGGIATVETRSCSEDDLKHFLDAMSVLGDKLGPLLFQFAYFNKSAFKPGAEFLARLRPFLKHEQRPQQHPQPHNRDEDGSPLERPRRENLL
jgi:uncharacterized protein YecE (DUF72 family)